MKYKDVFQTYMKVIGKSFNWTTKINKNLINHLIKTEIGSNHVLHNKEIVPIAILKNKYDLFGYYTENGKDIFVTIHFSGYKTEVESKPYYDEYSNINDAIGTIIDVHFALYENSRYNMMVESEEKKKQNTRNNYECLNTLLPKIYDVLLKMNEYRGQLSIGEDDELGKIQDLFQFYSMDFAYKIRSIFTLMEIGNYADSAIILRTLTETFIVYKYYLQKHNGKKLEAYIYQSKNNTIRIKDIMNKIVPGYYETLYSSLCLFTHGNPIATGLFRGNVNKEDRFKYNMYNINDSWITFIINLTLPLIIGFFNMFKKVYVKNTLKTNQKLVKEIKEIKNTITKDMNTRYKKIPKQREGINLYRKIISFE